MKQLHITVPEAKDIGRFLTTPVRAASRLFTKEQAPSQRRLDFERERMASWTAANPNGTFDEYVQAYADIES